MSALSRNTGNGPSSGASSRSRGDKRTKKSIIGILSNVAELGAARMEETIGKASLRDASIGTGIAVDKMLALTGQTPTVNIANIWMPSEEERALIDADHSRLDAIARRLMESCEPKP